METAHPLAGNGIFYMPNTRMPEVAALIQRVADGGRLYTASAIGPKEGTIGYKTSGIFTPSPVYGSRTMTEQPRYSLPTLTPAPQTMYMNLTMPSMNRLYR